MSSEKQEKIIILGGSGSGKDFLFRKLSQMNLRGCLKMTTRPQRKYEIQLVNYNFVDEYNFLEKINNDEFLCYQTFNVTPKGRDPEIWYYGITKQEFEQSKLFIMTPGEFYKLTPEQRKGCFVVYLDIDRKVREKRLFNREDKNDDVSRRLDADEMDFKGFKDYDLKITDPEFEAEWIYNLMN